RDDVGRGPLGCLDTDDAGCAAAGDHVAGGGVEFLLLDRGADGGREVGHFIDGHQVEWPPEVGGDLALFHLQEQVGAFVNQALEPVHDLDRVINRGTDELVGAGGP